MRWPVRLAGRGVGASTFFSRSSSAVMLALVLALLPFVSQGALQSTRLDWGSKAPMPTLRARLGLAAAPNGKLYAVGGSATVEEYDPATNTWTSTAPMSTARDSLGLAVARNGKLYAVGGFHDGTVMGTVEEYDPATNTWTNCGQPAPGNACTSMPTARAELGLATGANGKLYAIGGSNPGDVNTVEEYDPAANTWTLKAPMSAARSRLGLVAAPNGKLYAVGGLNPSDQVINTVEEYDPATNTWTNCGQPAPTNACTSMPTARFGLGLTVAPNGKLYAVGGFNPGAGPPGCPRACITVEEYDPATNAWTTKRPMPSPRYDFGLAAAPNGRLYAVGGADQIPPFWVEVLVTTVEEYDPTGNAWAVPPAREPMLTARYALGLATATNNKLYAVGGQDGSTLLPTTEEYNPATNGWSTRAMMPGGARVALGLAAHPNGKLYAVGGGNPGFLGRLEAYDPAANTWQGGLPALAVARQSLGVAVGSDGLVYAAGGYNGADRDQLDAYAIGAPQWTTLQHMIVKRQAPALVATPSGQLYAIGGYNNGLGGPQNSVEVYDIATNLWSTRASMGTARYALQAILGPNGHIYAVGGVGTAGIIAVVEEYDPAANAWRTVAPMPTARAGLGLALGPNGRGFAIGGVATGQTGLKTVEELTFTELPSASAGGPYTVASGSSIQLNGSGSDPEGSALAYAWDLDGDLLYETGGQSPTFSAVGLPVGTRTVRMRAADTSGAYGLASTTVTVTAAPTACSPRPNVGVTTAKIGVGQLQATLTAQTLPATPTNSLSSIRIISIVNAAVTLNGSPVTAGATIPLVGGTQQATLLLDRNAPGQNPGLASTVAFAVTDGCGEWRSFVGGGPSAF